MVLYIAIMALFATYLADAANIACRPDQWTCQDTRTCIPLDGKCDGVVDCPDGSDERHGVCRSNLSCPPYAYRCTYGACVDGDAQCNGIKECLDGSDEVRCEEPKRKREINGTFKCDNDHTIPSSDHCDGRVDCADGSDETLESCAGRRCEANLFQCKYGACVDADAACDPYGIKHCADGSDEDVQLCNITENRPCTTCVLSEYPAYGTYEVVDHGTTGPEQAFNSIYLRVTCNGPDNTNRSYYYYAHCEEGLWKEKMKKCRTFCKRPSSEGVEYVCYDIYGPRLCNEYEPDGTKIIPNCSKGYRKLDSRLMQCIDGKWDYEAKCEKGLCKLTPHPSVTYFCKPTDPNILSGDRKCNDLEPSGTEVHPRCNDNYYHSGDLSNMNCIDGSWDYVATCELECGTRTPDGMALMINGVSAKRGELSWHTGIYDKRLVPYMQICGGSLVSTTVVISAAHCFWDDVEEVLPASNYAVGVGKIYRPWKIEEGGQKSDVSDIKVPPRFRGASNNFQDDIALVILVTPIVLNNFVRPVCIDFNVLSDERQLQPGNVGKVAGWGLTSVDGNASQVLKVTDLAYVDVEQCISDLPFVFRSFITSDKICAGKNGTALCKGDSGGGLVFPEVTDKIQRWYLRGVVSTAPSSGHKCNSNSYTSFTQLLKHDDFVRKHLCSAYEKCNNTTN